MLNSVNYSESMRRIGISSSIIALLLGMSYSGILSAGILSLKDSKGLLVDPFFSIIECLIMVLALIMVLVMAAIHAWAPPEQKYSLLALLFMSLLAGLTCCVHVVILLVSRQIASANMSWPLNLLSFNWQSIAYATDVLAWNGFFGLSLLFAAPLFSGDRLRSSIRFLLAASGILSILGMIGLPFDDMLLQILGLLGHIVTYPVAITLLAVMFYCSQPLVEGYKMLPDRSAET